MGFEGASRIPDPIRRRHPSRMRMRMRRSDARRALAALALALGGCTLLPLGGRPTERVAAPSPWPGLREYRAAFHVHGELSHDSEGSVGEIARAARTHGIELVLMTDHYEPGDVSRAPRGVHGGVLFVPGVELRADGGSLLGVGPRDDFEKSPGGDARLAALRRAGAVAVLGHVERLRSFALGPVDGFEVFNLHAQLRQASKLAVFLRALALPPDAFFEGAIESPERNLALWDRELRRGRRLAPLAGHDAHANVRIGLATVGTYAEVFRLFSTRVLAARLEEASILEALRLGHTIVVFDFLGDASGFAMSYDAPHALAPRPALPGDSLVHRSGHRLRVRLPDGAPPDAEIRLLRDGEPIARERAPRLERPLPGPGIYRVEVRRGERLWILPAALWLGARAQDSARRIA